MIRVLPEYHDFYFLEWTDIKRAEDIFRRGIYCSLFVFFLHKFRQLRKIRFFKLARETLLPRLFYCDFHTASISYAVMSGTNT